MVEHVSKSLQVELIGISEQLPSARNGGGLFLSFGLLLLLYCDFPRPLAFRYHPSVTYSMFPHFPHS